MENENKELKFDNEIKTELVSQLETDLQLQSRTSETPTASIRVSEQVQTQKQMIVLTHEAQSRDQEIKDLQDNIVSIKQSYETDIFSLKT